jgi:hypothetical protein
MTPGETVEKLRVIPDCQVAVHFKSGSRVAKIALRRETIVRKVRRANDRGNYREGPLFALLKPLNEVSFRPNAAVRRLESERLI